MKNRKKRLAVLLGVALLAACQMSNVEVRAVEPVPLETAEESFTQSEDVTKTESDDSNALEDKNAGDDTVPKSQGENETTETDNVKTETDVSDKSKSENAGDDMILKTEDENAATGTDNSKSEANVPKVKDTALKTEGENTTTKTDSQNNNETLKPEAAEQESIKTATESSDIKATATQALVAENLRWQNGQAVFYNPNEGKVQFEIHIYKDGAYAGGKITTQIVLAESKEDISVNLYLDRFGDGTYTYKVVTYADGVTPDHKLTSGLGVVSQESEGYNTTADSQQFRPAEGLMWSDTPDFPKGMAWFMNTNERGVIYKVQLCHDGEAIRQPETYPCENYKYGGYIDLFYFEGYIVESGTYVFEVVTINAENGNVIGTACSAPYEYTRPEKQLSTPTNGTWNPEGFFSCEWAPTDPDDTVSFRVTHQGQTLTPFGSNYVKTLDIEITTQNGQCKFDLNEYLSKRHNLTPANGDYIEVQAVSQNIEEYTNSAWSEKIAFEGSASSSDSNPFSSDSSSSSNEGSSFSAPAKMWEPETPDEIKRYAVYSKEKAEYTTDAANAYAVVINNAMQGALCFDSFEAVLGDYTIGRTYDITPSGKTVYKMDTKARITLSIPQSLQAEDREYKMICVTENGQPIILDDLDSNATTITFETDTYHAYALIYRNAAVLK